MRCDSVIFLPRLRFFSLAAAGPVPISTRSFCLILRPVESFGLLEMTRFLRSTTSRARFLPAVTW